MKYMPRDIFEYSVLPEDLLNGDSIALARTRLETRQVGDGHLYIPDGLTQSHRIQFVKGNHGFRGVNLCQAGNVRQHYAATRT